MSSGKEKAAASERCGDEAVTATLRDLRERCAHEKEFLQAAEEILESLAPVVNARPELAKLLPLFVEPERTVMFRVPWTDDAGAWHVNRGYRVQFNSAIGPYKGGLRFHPSVQLSVLKFLGIEQILKNSLTTLPMGGGKGGSDFDPKGKSDAEVMRFCQSFATELQRHVGATTDVPAGDIGVGGREIGYLYGQYKRIVNRSEGVLTGKHFAFGGSRLRPEATGYGVVYFTRLALGGGDDALRGKRVLVSGAGNVAQYTIEEALALGAVVLSASDSGGYVVEEDGFDERKLRVLMQLKNERRGRLADYPAAAGSGRYVGDGARPWREAKALGAHIALPCATQNELDADDAAALLDSDALCAVVEGANMPTTPDAMRALRADAARQRGIVFGPAKAANAGGVAVSGLEMSQNAQHLQWSRDEVDERLQRIMSDVYSACVDTAKRYDRDGDLVFGANAAGFERVANAMLAQGCV